MASPTVQILLATCNGEAYVREQMRSLLAQTWADFEILVGDDGSQDATLAIVDALAREVPGRIRIVQRQRVGGAARNFMRLVDAADAPYVMCCDQDDVWLPDKVAVLLARCRALEALHPGQPVLVHSDLTVVDAALRVIHPSLFEYQRIDPTKSTLRDLLMQSGVTECAMLMNRPLVELVKGSDPDDMIMHDWWISLAAAAFGVIDVLREPTVLYRQHGSNTLGAKRAGPMHVVRRLVALARGGRLNRHLRRCFRQAAGFHAHSATRLRPDDRRDCALVAGLAVRPPLNLRYALLRHRLLRQGLLRNIVTLLVV